MALGGIGKALGTLAEEVAKDVPIKKQPRVKRVEIEEVPEEIKQLPPEERSQVPRESKTGHKRPRLPEVKTGQSAHRLIRPLDPSQTPCVELTTNPSPLAGFEAPPTGRFSGAP